MTCPDGRSVTVAQPVTVDGEGELMLTSGNRDPIPVDLDSGSSVTQDVDGPSVLRATGALAPGLLAATQRGKQRAECVVPGGEWWFAAAGAGGSHVSTVTLTNPDDSPAIVDLDVWNADGPVSNDAVRGIAVAGGATVTRDLAELVPGRDDVVVRVVVRQGRVGAHVTDEQTASPESSPVWHPSTAAPSTRVVIPAVPKGKLTLVVGNTGDESARARILVSGARSESVPLDLDAVPVPAGEVVSVELDANTRKLLQSGEASLVVESTAALVGSVRGTVGGRGALTLGAVDAAARRSAVVLPDLPDRTLVLSAVERATAATVHFIGADAWQGRLQPGVSTAVPVPDGASIAWVETDSPHLGAVRGQGPAAINWLPLRELREDRLVPAVRPDQLRTDR
ncbi:DUF5719 family protein [Nocardioides alcanivorans]|uniref:DUF5719 family protein n=1 Tax=Nocardioides alcanivorans TaxID=2897352 RepID=UPI001F15BD6F|nr:DUF5719 family protein [Nocardioides alcanivorans]